MTIKHVEEIAATLGGKIESMERLPDGTGAATISYPLPKDHWIYAKDPQGNALNPPMTFRMPVSHPRYRDFVDRVREAAKYAVRSATMGGTETDFDPDALIGNLIVGLTGYATDDALSHQGDDMWNPKPIPPLMDFGLRPIGEPVPYFSRPNALRLKERAEVALYDPDDPRPSAECDISVSAQAILSLIEQSWSPHLGLASTRQLLDEVRTRIEVHWPGGLEYRTVDGEDL